ncbi:MAG: periplasmic heavy metal sensor [Polyangiaceae bacterium]|jgi:uncharacterized membrane protein|nr:periplasmic heavy metal sensor [Polyangiaceae bacterium]
MTNAPKRPWALLFLVSLGINLFLGGVITTRWMTRRPPQADLRPFPVMRMRRALGPEAAPAIDRAMDRHGRELARRRRETRDARQLAFEALCAEPYQRNRAAAALTDFRTKLGAMQQTMDEVMLELAAELTPQQRSRLQEAMEQGTPLGGGRGRRHRFGQMGGPGPGPADPNEAVQTPTPPASSMH